MADVVNPLVQALLNRMDFPEHNLLQQSRHDIEALATRSQQEMADVRAQLSTVQRSQAPPARPPASHRGPGVVAPPKPSATKDSPLMFDFEEIEEK